jgi:hypothetical protein
MSLYFTIDILLIIGFRFHNLICRATDVRSTCFFVLAYKNLLGIIMVLVGLICWGFFYYTRFYLYNISYKSAPISIWYQDAKQAGRAKPAGLSSRRNKSTPPASPTELLTSKMLAAVKGGGVRDVGSTAGGPGARMQVGQSIGSSCRREVVPLLEYIRDLTRMRSRGRPTRFQWSFLGSVEKK